VIIIFVYSELKTRKKLREKEEAKKKKEEEKAKKMQEEEKVKPASQAKAKLPEEILDPTQYTNNRKNFV
jgi:lysyl-tRNA synthetase, class II